MHLVFVLGVYNKLRNVICIATALTSDGQLRRGPAISGILENKIFNEIL